MWVHKNISDKIPITLLIILQSTDIPSWLKIWYNLVIDTELHPRDGDRNQGRQTIALRPNLLQPVSAWPVCLG